MPMLYTDDAKSIGQTQRRLALMLVGTVGVGAALPSRAGLADWLHGSPPPRPKLPPPDKIAIVSRAAGVAPDPQVEDFLRALAAAIQARDGKSMLPHLAERYVVDDLPGGLKASDFFVQAIEQIPGADEIVIRSVAMQGNVRIAQADFHFPKQVIKSRSFRFDANGLLLASDLFKLKRQGDGG